MVENVLNAGELVTAKGTLAMSETNDESFGLCLHLSIIEPLQDPNLEMFHWLMTMKQMKESNTT